MASGVIPTHQSSVSYLDPAKRPEFVVQRIENAFQTAEQLPISMGERTTTVTYGIAGIKECELICSLIANQPLQSTFNVIDFGLGHGRWGEHLAQSIHQNVDKIGLGRALSVAIYCVREEPFGYAVGRLGICRIHKIGSFKIEEIAEEFKRRGLDLDSQVDCVLSNRSLEHLVDPLGTFTQILNLMRPHSGIALVNGFDVQIEEESKSDPHVRMLQILSQTNATFLRARDRAKPEVDQFILRRRDETPCQLPMEYMEFSKGSGSKCTTRLFRESPFLQVHIPMSKSADENYIRFLNESCVHGDGELYLWLRQNGLFDNKRRGWLPIEFSEQKAGPSPIGLTQSGMTAEDESSYVVRALWESDLKAQAEAERQIP